MTWQEALNLSWEQINALAAAQRRREAESMLLFMVAAQGDDKSWKRQREMLLKILKQE